MGHWSLVGSGSLDSQGFGRERVHTVRFIVSMSEKSSMTLLEKEMTRSNLKQKGIVSTKVDF